MKRKIGLMFRVVCFLLLLMAMESCSSETENKQQEERMEKPASEIHTVEITQMRFFPREITVKKGDRIVFVNRDMVAHDVTEEKTKAWTSTPLQTEQTWMLVAERSAGYFCSLHPVMKGKIIVQ